MLNCSENLPAFHPETLLQFIRKSIRYLRLLISDIFRVFSRTLQWDASWNHSGILIFFKDYSSSAFLMHSERFWKHTKAPGRIPKSVLIKSQNDPEGIWIGFWKYPRIILKTSWNPMRIGKRVFWNIIRRFPRALQNPKESYKIITEEFVKDFQKGLWNNNEGYKYQDYWKNLRNVFETIRVRFP